MQHRDLRAWKVRSLILIACDRSPAKPEFQGRAPNDRSSQRPAEGLTISRSNDCGILIGGPGRTRDVEYPITNTSNRAVRILEVTNAKPCCGIIALTPPPPTVLQPGASATLKVRLKLGGAIGPLSHRTLIVTDETGQEPIEIWNFADVKPRIAGTGDFGPRQGISRGRRCPRDG